MTAPSESRFPNSLFDQRSAPSLAELAEQNTQLRRNNQALARDLEQLRMLARITVDELDTRALVQALVEQATQCLDVEQAFLGLVVDEEVRVDSVYHAGIHQPVNVRFQSGEGVAGWMLIHKQPFLANPPLTTPPLTPEYVQGFACYNLLCLPILNHQNDVLGVLEVHNKRGQRPFDQHDLLLAQTIALQAAVALERSRLFDRMQEWANSLESLLAFNASINKHLNPPVLIRRLVERAAGFLGADGGLAGLAEGAQLHAEGHWHHGSWHELNARWSAEEGLAGWVLVNQCPYLSHDYANDRLADPKWIDQFDIRCALCVPILDAEEQVLGFFELHKGPARQPFTWADASFLESLANTTAVAIRNAQLVKELELHREQLQALSAHHVTRLEEERQRLARTLHDEAGQALVGIRLSLKVLARQIPPDRHDLLDLTDQVRDQVSHSTAQLRTIAQRLRPPTLDELGLGAALTQLAADFQQRTHLVISFDQEVFEPRLHPAIEIACYRIVQEALTNVAQHAEASRVDISLKREAAAVRLVIRDDGCGFDPKHITEGGLGLLGMQERALMLNGQFALDSQPGAGTTLSVTIPAARPDEARP